MLGPALAGVIIAVLGSGVGATGWVILLNGVSYVAVVISLKRMRSEELHPTAPLPRAKGQLRDGLRYVRGRPDIVLVMVVVFFVGTFGFNFQMTTALMATAGVRQGGRRIRGAGLDPRHRVAVGCADRRPTPTTSASASSSCRRSRSGVSRWWPG